MRFVKRTAPIALVAVCLGGCDFLQTPPGLASAQTTVPPRFATRIGGATLATDSSGAFWDGFGAPELGTLTRRAEAGSLDIKAAMSRIAEAAAVRDQAVTSLLPSGAGQATQTRARISAASQTLAPTPSYPSYNLGALGLSASYEIDFWGKNRATLDAAENSLKATGYDADTVRLTVTANTASLYLYAVSLKDQIAVARSNVRFAEKIADSIRQRVEAGSATEIDRAQQETLVLQQRATIPQLERALGETELQISILLGDVPGQLKIEESSLDRLSLPIADRGLPSDLLRRRPDVAAAEFRVLVAAQNVTAARAAMLPSFTLNATVGQQSLRTATLLSPQALAYQVVGGVAIPLLDQVRLAAQLRGQKAVQEELVFTYREAILTALVDVETALVDLATLQRQEATLRAAVAQARRAYNLGDEQLAAGQIDLLTVLQAQTAYFQTLSSLKQVQAVRYQAGVALFKALGGGWSDADRAAARAAALRPFSCPHEGCF